LPASASSEESQLYQQLLWQQYWSQYQTLQSSLRRTRAEQAASKEIIRKLEQTLPIVTKRVNIMEKLHREGFASETDYLQGEQERIQIQQDLAAEKQQYQQLKAAESEVREQVNTRIA